jgi:hypothetical protein
MHKGRGGLRSLRSIEGASDARTKRVAGVRRRLRPCRTARRPGSFNRTDSRHKCPSSCTTLRSDRLRKECFRRLAHSIPRRRTLFPFRTRRPTTVVSSNSGTGSPSSPCVSARGRRFPFRLLKNTGSTKRVRSHLVLSESRPPATSKSPGRRILRPCSLNPDWHSSECSVERRAAHRHHRAW